MRDSSPARSFPYLSKTMERLAGGDDEYRQAFARHWHWGYWTDPAFALGTVEDYARAAERMSEQVLFAARLNCGQRILDAGCGFGGTIAVANERYEQIYLTGLNIDLKQLEVARRSVVARSGNSVELVVADACEPPFLDASFDRVMAVECIFHFPSRERFFRQARRLLKPGGLLVVSDFVASRRLVYTPLRLLFYINAARRARTWGTTHALEGTSRFYQRIAARTGFTLLSATNITRNVQPTHRVLIPLAARLDPKLAASVLDVGLGLLLGFATYQILVFQASIEARHP